MVYRICLSFLSTIYYTHISCIEMSQDQLVYRDEAPVQSRRFNWHIWETKKHSTSSESNASPHLFEMIPPIPGFNKHQTIRTHNHVTSLLIHTSTNMVSAASLILPQAVRDMIVGSSAALRGICDDEGGRNWSRRC
jgi:hypothetical protein